MGELNTKFKCQNLKKNNGPKNQILSSFIAETSINIIAHGVYLQSLITFWSGLYLFWF